MYDNKLVCTACGGELSYSEENAEYTCLGCQCNMIETSCDHKKLNRITYLRNNLRFAEASALAASLIEENPNDSEAYWAAFLCDYGITYPRSASGYNCVFRKFSTAMPAPTESENYKRALYYAAEDKQNRFAAMGNAIMEAYNAFPSFIEKTQSEETDIFILVPENIVADDDLDGCRLYLRFTENLNFKTFYAPESLSEMTDAEKAAATMAAIKKARILVAVFRAAEECTSGYFNYVVDAFAKDAAAEDSDKVLIPVFDSSKVNFQQLPESLVFCDEAYDSSDGEFMREISDKVESILKPEEAAVVPDAIVTATAANKENLVKRAYMFLEDGEFETADTYFDKILDIDIEDSRAYIGKLLAECKLKSEDEIANLPQKIDNDKNYKKAIRFATPEQKAHYESLAGAIAERIDSEVKRVSEERQRLNAERAEREEAERLRRERQNKEERKLQYQRRRDPLRKTLLEVQAELGKAFLTPKRKKELLEEEETLKKNLKELDMVFPDIFD